LNDKSARRQDHPRCPRPANCVAGELLPPRTACMRSGRWVRCSRNCACKRAWRRPQRAQG